MMSRRVALTMLVVAGMTAASCRSGQSLTNAGIDRPATPTTASTIPGQTTVPTAPPTTQPRKLDSLPSCDATKLDSAAASGPVNITFWHGLSNELGRELDKLTAAYNASQTKVKVNLEFQGGYEQTIDKYLQSNTANRPDMVQMPEYMVQQMIDTKSLVPTQACAESAKYDTSPFLPQALGAYATEGVQWSMPFNMSVPVLYFLKPRFTSAGLDPENPPRSLEDLLAASKKIVSSGASAYSLALDSDFDGGGGWYIEQWLSKSGEFYSDNENGRSAPATHVLYDGASGVKLLTYLQSLVTEGGSVYVGDNASGTDTFLKLADASKPASMTIATSAALGPVLNVLGGGLIPGVTRADVGVGVMPGPNNGDGALVGGASLYIVDGKGGEKAAAAWDYITFLESAATQSEWAAATGYIPVRTDALDIEPIKSLYVSDPRFKVAYDQLISSLPGPTSQGPVIGPLKQVRRVTATAVADILSGGDVQAALTKAAQGANDLITNYNAQNK
jgi:sn-glycerol 3-phosphate transport system substrate-binding protein